MDVRQHHLDGVRKLIITNNYITGGAMLNDEGKMIGSTMILQFETEEELDGWKQREIYITGKIWEAVDIKPFKVAQL